MEFPNRIRYTGQQYDEFTEQYYLRARYYNPILGRFMQEDVYQGDGLNLYAYCGNNPVTYYDPSGYTQKKDPCGGNWNIGEEQGGDDLSSEKNAILDNPSIVGHIFQDEPGHIPDTPENRVLLENTSNNENNYRGDDQYGNSWYTSNQDDGSEIWVETRNGNIIDGGINSTPRPWDPNTGLKKP